MAGRLPKGTKFVRGPGFKKYKAILPDGRSVTFGDRRYQQYKDSVPRSMGGGLWKSMDHNDSKRRNSYRARHSGLRCKDGTQCIRVKYSPAWFSYHYLW